MLDAADAVLDAADAVLDAADAVLDAADAVLRCARAAPTNFTQTMLAPAHGEIRLPRGGSQG